MCYDTILVWGEFPSGSVTAMIFAIKTGCTLYTVCACRTRMTSTPSLCWRLAYPRQCQGELMGSEMGCDTCVDYRFVCHSACQALRLVSLWNAPGWDRDSTAIAFSLQLSVHCDQLALQVASMFVHAFDPDPHTRHHDTTMRHARACM